MLNRFWQIQLATKKENFHCYHDWRASGVGLDSLLLMIWVVMYESSKASKSRMGVFPKCEDPNFKVFFGGWKINSKDEGPWVWKILPNADVCVLNRFHQGQDNHLLSINKPRRWHTWQGRGRFWNSHDHNEVRKIRRWRSVIFDWFSSNFWDLIHRCMNLRRVTCQMFY